MASKVQGKKKVSESRFYWFTDAWTARSMASKQGPVFLFGGMPSIYNENVQDRVPKEFRDVFYR